MPIQSAAPLWPRLTACTLVCLSLLGCASTPPRKPVPPRLTWAGVPIGSPPEADPHLKRAMINRALGEWEYFGRQTVVFHGADESIPHVGSWEDDDAVHSDRVSMYWRAVGKPGLDGMDCRQPWSAAFISWVMDAAGVPRDQFQRATAHSVYLASLIDQAVFPGRIFIPRRVADYSPDPGDLICAPRGGAHPSGADGYTSPWMLQGVNTHCDLVVAKSGQRLEVVGGNVRNSVSRTTLELDGRGHLRALPRRPWFLIMENRL
ncbi:DUF2272 domain-containing protein [uncultured Thiodictyon sp.]|uniref:DUF2272 domain-containing protein n=1 Tax=uncultured Thiodictyon sp. TaxID=1846217 RepID=UPI0025D676E0|nr:DUF2272 domain-containing protein [uncultured Thiodictyon sp.]